MIALIDYGMGNLLNVSKALESVGAKIETTDNPREVAQADAVILPGVGNFGDGMEHLHSKGLAEPVLKAIGDGKPFLGICLGMQMLMERSDEAPGVDGLGIFKGQVVRFPSGSGEKVPHMGWNSLCVDSGHPALDGIDDGSYFYFVHSYYVAPEDSTVTAASCKYIVKFAAALGWKNIFATQFHPEKSQDKGIKILDNFVSSLA